MYCKRLPKLVLELVSPEPWVNQILGTGPTETEYPTASATDYKMIYYTINDDYRRMLFCLESERMYPRPPRASATSPRGRSGYLPKGALTHRVVVAWYTHRVLSGAGGQVLDSWNLDENSARSYVDEGACHSGTAGARWHQREESACAHV